MRLGVTFHVVYAGIAYAVLCRVYAANAVNGMSAAVIVALRTVPGSARMVAERGRGSLRVMM